MNSNISYVYRYSKLLFIHSPNYLRYSKLEHLDALSA